MSEPNMLDPMPELPDDTPISNVEFPARICNVLAAAGLKTIGEVRETSDEILLSFQDSGKASVAYLRETLGLPSCDGGRAAMKRQRGSGQGQLHYACDLCIDRLRELGLARSGPCNRQRNRRFGAPRHGMELSGSICVDGV